MSGVGGVNGPGGPYGVEGDSGGSEDFSPAGIAASQILNQALKIIFGEGVKDTSLASPMSLAASAPPSQSKAKEQGSPFGPDYFMKFYMDNEQTLGGKKCILPTMGGPLDGEASSESLYYGMEYFLKNGEKDKFQLCVNTFQYLAAHGTGDGLPAWHYSSGKDPIAPPVGTIYDAHSATDFDIKLTDILIRGQKQLGLTDADTPGLDDSIKGAITGLTTDDIDGSNNWMEGNFQNHSTCVNCYAWDYVDPTAVNTIAQYCTQNNMGSQATTLGQATNTFLKDVLTKFQNSAQGYFDSAKDGDASNARAIMYLSNFILNTDSTKSILL